jgi:hypothetical protein
VNREPDRYYLEMTEAELRSGWEGKQTPIHLALQSDFTERLFLLHVALPVAIFVLNIDCDRDRDQSINQSINSATTDSHLGTWLR